MSTALKVAAVAAIVVAGIWMTRGVFRSPAQREAALAPAAFAGHDQSHSSATTPAEPDRTVVPESIGRRPQEDQVTDTADSAALNSAESFGGRLDRVAETFLTRTPDILGLVNLWDEFARSASVVAETVKHDGPLTTGELSVAGSDLRVAFEVERGHYRVSFDTPVTAGNDFVQRSVSMGFSGAEGFARTGSTTVQFHPNTRVSAVDRFQAGENLLLGWTVPSGEAGASVTAISAALADDGHSWQIGRLGRIDPISSVHSLNGRAEQAVMDKLAVAVR